MKVLTLVLLVAGLLAVACGGGDDQSFHAPKAELAPGFPIDFPVPEEATLINAFALGSAANTSYGATWRVQQGANAVESFYRGGSTERWAALSVQSLLSTTTVTFTDRAEEFEAVSVQIDPDGDGSRVAVTLARSSQSADSNAGDELQLPERPAVSADAQKPLNLPESFVPPGAQITDSAETPDGGTVSARMTVGMQLPDVVAFFQHGVRESTGVEPIVTREGDVVLLSWRTDAETGFIVITGGATVSVGVLIQS